MDEWNRLITNIAGGLVDWLTDCWTNGTGRRTYHRTNMRAAVVGMDRVMGCAVMMDSRDGLMNTPTD